MPKTNRNQHVARLLTKQLTKGGVMSPDTVEALQRALVTDPQPRASHGGISTFTPLQWLKKRHSCEGAGLGACRQPAYSSGSLKLAGSPIHADDNERRAAHASACLESPADDLPSASTEWLGMWRRQTAGSARSSRSRTTPKCSCSGAGAAECCACALCKRTGGAPDLMAPLLHHDMKSQGSLERRLAAECGVGSHKFSPHTTLIANVADITTDKTVGSTGLPCSAPTLQPQPNPPGQARLPQQQQLFRHVQSSRVCRTSSSSEAFPGGSRPPSAPAGEL